MQDGLLAPGDSELLETARELAAGLGGDRKPPARDGEPPSDEQIEMLLAAATAVPDHGYLRPWRFAIISGEGRERLAEALAQDMSAGSPVPLEDLRERAHSKAFAAPCLFAVISSPRTDAPIPEWEQVASATCAGYAIILAAQALGLGSIWKSPAVRDGARFLELFRLQPGEKLLGWVLVGSRYADSRPSKREALAPESFAMRINE